MTKQDYIILKQAGEILERLSNEDGINTMLPTHYRNSLNEAQDHFSQFMYSTEKEEEAVVIAGFWNDELRQVIEAYPQLKDSENNPYQVFWQRDNVNEWELSITTSELDEDETDELAGNYDGYLDEESVIEDLKLLLNAGIKLIHADGGEPFQP